MITGELKSKIDRIWDTVWSDGVSNLLARLAKQEEEIDQGRKELEGILK